ncbi:MAG: hypothetical protein A3F54_01270 [Candidatus Kerfeldbacteria bacterium RIFCSPHIGHO2_12_FULL_48_17]|uniref:Uncharacterized protein n=1 Tax=Candidatus Kerfeldbacteria bacterium RIFCSPHIGHO2_12_FULL_48_17 TaxID=1798542 RepID=A0A1G2AYA1_9BACT|nr:MAG: hypothetical protein A3F54_01270 [Candidatus Kerfeldbacteria bacterium RIFCSPHIGHO2_12_FULL_48_17]
MSENKRKTETPLQNFNLPLVKILTTLTYFLGVIAPVYFILWFSTTRNLRTGIPFFGIQKFLLVTSILTSFIIAIIVYANTRKHQSKKEDFKKLLDEKIIPDNLTQEYVWRRYHILIKLYIGLSIFFWGSVYLISAWISTIIRPLV